MLLDTLNRPLRDLRISVTDRGNFRCVYCMPKEVFGGDFQFLEREQLLTFEEITRLARVFVTQPFCRDCTRARLSPEGSLYTCRFGLSGFDLRARVRGGASDEELARAIGRVQRSLLRDSFGGHGALAQSGNVAHRRVRPSLDEEVGLPVDLSAGALAKGEAPAQAVVGQNDFQFGQNLFKALADSAKKIQPGVQGPTG